MSDEAPLTITVPEAGKKYFNLSRDASYAAAQRDDIPTIRIGRLLRVPVQAMERKLGIEAVVGWQRRPYANPLIAPRRLSFSSRMASVRLLARRRHRTAMEL
jgi:hypothetical protein